MKNFSVAILGLAVTSISFAQEGGIYCDWMGSKGRETFEEQIDLTKDYSHFFKDEKFPELEVNVIYQATFKGVDTLIRDKKLNVEAIATEWMNETPVGAHSAVKLKTQKGTFILSCSVH